MYYAALRPGEAVELRKEALSIPTRGWGELYLSTSAPAGRTLVAASARPAPRGGVDLAQRGVPAPQVGAWAGHSVDVLLRVYAKCIAGQEDAARRGIELALRDDR
jgi:hypothetical protein